MNEAIQGLWVGPRLSTMERLSISSFLANGHEYHLYVYDDVDGVPKGTILKDAAEILPSSRIFQYRDRPSYAGFSNFFRYKLLLERGGWWMDTDVVCLKPFSFDSEYVFAGERDSNARECAGSGVIKAPAGSELMKHAWQTCQAKKPEEIKWGETGPILMHALVMRHSLYDHMRSADVFCPIDPEQWFAALIPGKCKEFGADTVAVHLWNELWRLWTLDKDEIYAPSCLYERLKLQYLSSSNGTAERGRHE
jgi:hypothetical protein